jgi:hypothetical protein
MGEVKSIHELFRGRHFDREVIILCVPLINLGAVSNLPIRNPPDAN